MGNDQLDGLSRIQRPPSGSGRQRAAAVARSERLVRSPEGRAPHRGRSKGGVPGSLFEPDPARGERL